MIHAKEQSELSYFGDLSFTFRYRWYRDSNVIIFDSLRLDTGERYSIDNKSSLRELENTQNPGGFLLQKIFKNKIRSNSSWSNFITTRKWAESLFRLYQEYFSVSTEDRVDYKDYEYVLVEVTGNLENLSDSELDAIEFADIRESKTMITITENVQLPGTDIILEAGDKIRVVEAITAEDLNFREFSRK